MTKSTSSKSEHAKDVARQPTGTTEARAPESRSNSDIDHAVAPKKRNIKKSSSQASKKAKLIKLLGRSRGTSMNELETTLGWQPHSIRAAISGLRKSGHIIERTSTKSGPRYHICHVLKENRSKVA